MTSEIMMSFVDGRPFMPFEMHISDGRTIRVSHPELATIHRFALAVSVIDENGYAELFDVELVTSIRALRRSNNSDS